MMRRRGLGLVLALGLLVSGAAACGDDGGGSEGGNTRDEAGNDAIIEEYCDASEANAEALEASQAAPGDEATQDALEQASERLGEASDAVAPVVETFTEAQQAQFEECQS